MALRTHFTQTEIGCPGIAEFTVQRTKALFDHITGFRQISVAFSYILFCQVRGCEMPKLIWQGESKSCNIILMVFETEKLEESYSVGDILGRLKNW